ncbi:DNA (cytosine-5)-methyltransferase 1 [Halanaerobium congolense]|jgi:DNA (cytosine-5)-methyltransferase 1|uniref:Cytosine-specific methyltransferase n=1 Tax=Halanaerobium congolense TaxID=54121 RepID=A0A1I0CFJ0_9FIRM|nr:DNA cytosine methyltransferase [Halanaerobium congolense]PTX14805.1 DNA (cytosine-5)-methyltransferase 1 [Halanaerobium congolense]SDG16860.1 DNA (cytosine-5)-methyltransferase 1 [Halanaerobium congolense]SET17822.1 DNA (cytosine-5)-methyltransferase 1 [Halanaerobium congolense]SFP67805.1 DNA (cytosine-5)-methyltransferase 1 [Halanaerobium congolense]
MIYRNLKEKLNLDKKKDKALVSHYLNTLGFKANKAYNEAEEILEKNNISSEKISKNNDFMIKNSEKKFTFIDLFAGIGGMRIAMENLGGKCVFSSEIDKFAVQTYEYNFDEHPFGDIKEIEEESVPEHDILLAGFPCQSFSIAGNRGGFEDTRGTLFFDAARIIDKKRPSAFILENVKGLQSHDGGKTLKTILNTLRNDLNYFVPEPKVLNSRYFNVPQNRERIFIVGFRQDLNVEEFRYPKEKKETNLTFEDVMEEEVVSTKYYLSNTYLETLRKHKKRHQKKGNGFGYEIIPHDGIANAIIVGGMGRERNLIIDHRIEDYTPVTNIKGEVNREDVRRMTPIEWKRLQGFPGKFEFPVSDTQAYKQLGNSVTVPVVQAIGDKIVKVIEKLEERVLTA